jgi:transposase InsO family protein
VPDLERPLTVKGEAVLVRQLARAFLLSVFLKAHWRSIVAADFFTAEVWSLHGLVTYYVFFLIELAKRIVHIVGITTHPSEGWMMQVARNLTDRFSGFLMGKSHLILDRDTKYTAQFRRLIAESKTAVIRLPPRSPNLNAYAERFVRSIKEECLNRMIFVGQASLRRTIREFIAHYHVERNHQGVENRLLQPRAAVSMQRPGVQRHQRLGGMLNFYCRAVA